MGDLRSGRRADPGRARTVEECAGRLTVREWLAGDVPAGLVVVLVETRQRLGGVRWWFACPRCGRRRGVLYRPRPGADWGCRVCLGLTYRSCRESHRDELRHVSLDRFYARVDRLGGDPMRALAEATESEVLAVFRMMLDLDAVILAAAEQVLRELRARRRARRRAGKRRGPDHE